MIILLTTFVFYVFLLVHARKGDQSCKFVLPTIYAIVFSVPIYMVYTFLTDHTDFELLKDFFYFLSSSLVIQSSWYVTYCYLECSLFAPIHKKGQTLEEFERRQ